MNYHSGRAFYALAFLLLSITASAQTLWRQSRERLTDSLPPTGHYAVYELDLPSFQSALRKAPAEGSRNAAASILLPKFNGESIAFLLQETKLFTASNPAGAAVKTYSGRTADGRLVVHLTISDGNVQGMITGANDNWFIASPKANNTGKNLVEVYDLQGRPFSDKPTRCDADGKAMTLPDNTTGEAARTPSVSCAVKTYRLAIAGTADYTAYFGNQAAAFASTVALVNNVNAVYERDLGVRFVLATDETFMYTDAATDPFTNSAAVPCNELDISRTNFANTIGNANFDLGITLYGQNFGGCAYLGGTCNTLKGGANGGFSSPTATSYLLDVTLHEIGHLFNAGHTHNATGDGCTIDNVSAWEPGGGSTLMAYTNCSPSFQSYNTTLYFHGRNLGQMRQYISVAGGCYTSGAPNTSPLLTTPTDNTFYIPVSTPFKLSADATDAEDPSSLTYTFDQVDLGTGSPNTPSPTTALGPVFRSFEPSARSYRYLPRMDSIVAGINPFFESLPSINRNLAFWATVRDNRPGCGCQGVDTINVATSGSTPFRVTSQGGNSTFSAGSAVTITWDVAGTTGAPFNTTNVQLLFAADGLNYNTVLLASTPNDGSEQITLPNISATAGRVMVAAIGNLFFDINDANITVQTPCGDAQRNQLYPETKISAVQGSIDLQLNQTTAFGISSDGFDGEIAPSDPIGILGFRSSSGSATCSPGTGYNGRYDVAPFYIITPGSYTISTAGTLGGPHLFSLYGSGGYNPANVCDNFLYSNTWFTGGGGASLAGSFIHTLAGNSTYNLAFQAYGTTTYGTYRVSVSGPGPIFTELKNTGNSYSYVVVNAAGDVMAITTSAPDLRSYAAGTYYVYGISHSASVDLSSYQSQSFNNLLYGNFSAGGCVSISNNRREVVVRPGAILPLTSVQLSAAPESATARLRWTVSDEADAAGAVVEHSIDGAAFTPVAILATGQGRIASAAFGYYHRTPSGGRNFYRIRQTSRSGGMVYSNTAMVEFGTKPSISLTPNPTDGQVMVSSFGQQSFVPFVLRLYDNKGRQVGQYLVNQKVYSIDLSALPAGLYLAVGDGFSERVMKR